MIIKLFKGQFLQTQFGKKNIYELGVWNFEPLCIQIACHNSISGDLRNYEPVHTSRGNQWIN